MQKKKLVGAIIFYLYYTFCDIATKEKGGGNPDPFCG